MITPADRRWAVGLFNNGVGGDYELLISWVESLQ
jgi:hypothetical protein